MAQCEVCGSDYDKAFCAPPTNTSSPTSPLVRLRWPEAVGDLDLGAFVPFPSNHDLRDEELYEPATGPVGFLGLRLDL